MELQDVQYENSPVCEIYYTASLDLSNEFSAWTNVQIAVSYPGVSS